MLQVPLRKFPDIIERIEYVRTHLGLNKSRFSSEIGMKPQTYNNFIGAQGSKPNVELLLGIVTRFGVNPVWLFTGTGPMFMDTRGSPGQAPTTHQVNEPTVYGSGGPAGHVVDSLKAELASLEPLLRKVESEIRRLETTQPPLLDRLNIVMRRYLEFDPANATAELSATLERIEKRLSER
jgi:hypothetical protein